VVFSGRLRYPKPEQDAPAVRAIPIGVPDYADRFDKALESVLGKAAEEPGRALGVYIKLNGASSYSFAAGTLALLAFAIRNLPF